MKRQVFMYYIFSNYTDLLLFAKFVSTALLIVIQGSTVDCDPFFFYLFIFSTKYVTVSAA